MALTIGGQPATPEQLETLREALGVPADADMDDLFGRGPRKPVFIQNGFLVGQDGQQLGAIGIPATEQGGIAIVEINGTNYALLPVDEDGDIVANLAHRRDTLANLLALSGEPGEITIPTDAPGLVIHNGVAGEAVHFRGALSNNTLGAESLAMGELSGTSAVASRSLALGYGANATHIGEAVLGSAIPGIRRHVFQQGGRVVGVPIDDFVFLNNANNAGSLEPGGMITALPGGLYDCRVRILAREIGTNNFARFVRHAIVRISSTSSSATMSNKTTPEPDVNTGLAGLTADIGAMIGASVHVLVGGIDGKTIQWAAFIELNSMAITT